MYLGLETHDVAIEEEKNMDTRHVSGPIHGCRGTIVCGK